MWALRLALCPDSIIPGFEVVHKFSGKGVSGVAVSVMTGTTGAKLGKSAGSAVWLNTDKTSLFEFFQLCVRQQRTQ